MTKKNKLDRLLDTARGLVGNKHRAVSVHCCRGLELSEVAGKVEAACPPTLLPLLEEVVERAIADEQKQLEEAEARGEADHLPTGFFVWLYQLQAGVASLPETIPENVIRLWHRGSPAEKHPAVGFMECIPWARCERCRFVVPDADRDWRLCPVCGSERMGFIFLGNLLKFWYFDHSKGLMPD